ncbi:hypothetical protein V8C42DRAFT_146146 [Trichoderma barbatum]
MQRSRKKSCTQCRLAKARCSLSYPCSRCRDRDDLCEYSHKVRNISRGQILAPKPQQRTSGIGNAASVERQNYANERSLSAPLALRTSDMYNIDGISYAMGSSSFAAAISDIQPPLGESDNNRALHNYPFASNQGTDIGRDNREALQDFSPVISPRFFYQIIRDNESLHYPFLTGINMMLMPLDYRLRSRVLASQLDVGLRVDKFLSAKMLLGQIGAYPKMMAKGKHLPPFIHPPCVLVDVYPRACNESRHYCLPEILAICSSLLQMFYNTTPGSSSFAWKTIYEHQSHLYREALQATILYMLLQLQDPDTIDTNDTISLLETVGILAKRMYAILPYYIPAANTSGLDRQSWVLIESARRTICLLYATEIILHIMGGTLRQGLCNGYFNNPLPSTRDLWDAISTAEWAERYAQSLKGDSRDSLLRIQDLKSWQQYSDSEVTGEREQQALAKIAHWCENLDSFGALIWIATKIE